MTAKDIQERAKEKYKYSPFVFENEDGTFGESDTNQWVRSAYIGGATDINNLWLEFIDWSALNGWRYTKLYMKWVYAYRDRKTTAELFQIFLDNKNQTK